MQEKSFTIKFKNETYPAHYVKDLESTKQILEALSGKERLFGIDTETRARENYLNTYQAALSPKLARIRLIQIFDGVQAIVFDLDYIKDVSVFKKFLETERFVAHNAVFDLGFFIEHIGVTSMNLACTRLIARLLMHAQFPTDEGLDASLENLISQVFKERVLKNAQVSDWSIPELTFEQIEYSALDAVCVYKLAQTFAPHIEKHGMVRIYRLVKDVQLPLTKMSLNGMSLDVEKHKLAIAAWRADLYKAKEQLLTLTGLEDITPAKVGKWLEANLPTDIYSLWRRTPKGSLAVNADAFSDFEFLPIVAPFSTFQKKETLTSTFGTKLLDLINPESHRVHCSFNICGARTGRLSASRPNFQNFPRDKSIRSTFIPQKGWSFICADYSQIEVRVAAELSQDKAMLSAFRNGVDIHKFTASVMARKSLEDVSKDERQKAKAIVFGNLFGIGAKKFSHYSKKSYGVVISDAEAKDSIDLFRSTYSKYFEWQMDQATTAKQTLLVRTPCGKLRRLPADNTYGNSMNHPVQGGAAECMLHSLVYLEKALRTEGLEARLSNTVHDELLVEAPQHEANHVKKLVEECMTEGFLSLFPNGTTRGLVDAHVGKNWADAKP